MSNKPTVTAETRVVSVPNHGQQTQVCIDVELPAEVVEECRDDSGDLDVDEISDRIAVRPTPDGDPV